MIVFFGAPYMQYFSPEAGVENEHRERIDKMMSVFKNKPITVYSAYARENWVADIDSPEDAVDYDFRAIERADLLIAFLGDTTPSSGVILEIGFAAAQKKRICLFHSTALDALPFLIKGIHIWTEITFIEYTNDEDAYRKLWMLIDNEMKRVVP